MLFFDDTYLCFHVQANATDFRVLFVQPKVRGLPENRLPPNPIVSSFYPIKTAITWGPIPPEDVPGLLRLQTMHPCSGFTQRRRLEVVVAALPIALQKGQAVATPWG